MILAIDIGNTNIVFGVFSGDNDEKSLSSQWRMNSDLNKSVDDYAVDIIELFLESNLNITRLEGVVIGSVVPRLGQKIYKAINNFFKGKILLIGENCEIDIKIELENKDEIGSDRLLNALSAQKLFGLNLIIIDFGTATTFDVVNNKGAYIGGVIAPGVNISLQALEKAAAKLPKFEIKKQRNVIGKNTIEAMNSGVYFGYISLIEGVLKRIEEEYGEKMTKIITGGLAPLFKDELEITHYAPNLTLDGLCQVYFNN